MSRFVLGESSIHIGPGRLGLGLVVDLCLRAKIETHLLGRPGSPAAVGRFSLALTGRDQIDLDVASYSEVTCFEHLHEDAKAAVTEAKSMLVTTAVGGGLGDCIDLICEIASQRNGANGLRTIFIACENDAEPHYSELERRLEAVGVECRRTMVNRICPRCELNDREGTLVAYADPHAEWLIEGRPDQAVLESLDEVPEVTFVVDVEPFAVRKRWLVNGGHMILGLFALRDKETNIAIVARERDRQQKLREIQGDMVDVLPEEWHEALGDSIAYGSSEIEPMCRTKDETSRILHRLCRANVVPFFESMSIRVAEPARAYVERNGQLSGGLRDVFDVLDEQLLDLESYVDAIDVRTGRVRLSPEADQRSVDAYRATLTRVLPERVVAERVARFGRQLARHRLAYA